MLIKNEDNLKINLNFLGTRNSKFIKKTIKNFKFKKLLLISILSIPLTLGTAELIRKISNKLPKSISTQLNIISADLSFNEIASRQALTSIHKWPINYIKGLTTPIKVVDLNINQKNLNKLSVKSTEAIEIGVIKTNRNSYVNGFLNTKDGKKEIKIRLKGDNLDHLFSSTPSFRVRLKNGDTFGGLNKFSLQSPRVRLYASELIFQKFLEIYDLPSLNYEFVRLKLNGKNMGVYAIEEHFDKITIANNRLREGIIIALDENKWWDQTRRKYSEKRLEMKGYEIDRKVKVFDEKKVFDDSSLENQYIYASSILKGYINGKFTLSEVFEIDKLGRFLAIADLLGGHHAMHWNNLRFYYNPITKKLTPLGFDSDSGKKLTTLNGLSLHTGTFYNALKDPKLAKEYLSLLEKFSNQKYLENLFMNNEKYLKNAISQIHRSYPFTNDLRQYKKNIFHNQGFIKQNLDPIEPINIYLDKIDNNFISLTIENNSYFPIEIKNLLFNKKEIYRSEEDLIIPSRDISSTTEHKIILNSKDFNDFNNHNLSNYKVSYKILGTKKLLYSNINKITISNELPIKDNLYIKKDTLNSFNFVFNDEVNKIALIKKGTWIIDKPLIIPSNYMLKVNKGANIIFRNKGIIIAKNGINFLGTENDPISVTAENDGLGIIVKNSKTKSNLKNVIFKNLSNPTEKGLGITGAITFYESDVGIEDCIFENNNSEDYLNIIRSEFLIKNSRFFKTRSDAIDIDFGIGSLENIVFKDIGNDALDISGTKLNAKRILIDGAGDKGISIGESSKFNGDNIAISNVGIGIASKDGSEVTANSVNLKDSKIGFATYIKKPEYGPAYMNINSKSGKTNFNVSNLYLLESKSSFVIGSYRLPVNSKNIYQNLYK
tara:strand:+ start:704 stop:3364 length:2661 start_codon:yes stop_codon:yes gene_type:complete